MRTTSRTPIAACIVLAGAVAGCFLAVGEIPSPTEAGQEVSLAFKFDKPAYAAGEPIKVTLRVVNRGDKAVRLFFPMGQRYEITLEDASGREIWRWSRGRFFAQVLGEEVLNPKGGILLYTATLPAQKVPGRYKVRGSIVSRNRPLQASASIQIR